jgi:hypothetical protein
MKFVIVKPTKVRSIPVVSLAKPLPWRIDKNPQNPQLLAQWQFVNGRLQCRWFVD